MPLNRESEKETCAPSFKEDCGQIHDPTPLTYILYMGEEANGPRAYHAFGTSSTRASLPRCLWKRCARTRPFLTKGGREGQSLTRTVAKKEQLMRPAHVLS